MSELLGTIVAFLMSEQGLNLLAWILGIGISAVLSSGKVRGWLKESKIEKLRKATQYIEAAVLAQRNLVAKMKEENGGKLTEEQKEELEDRVIENLKTVGKEVGVDVVKIIGPELIRPAIVFAVKKLKGSGKKTVETSGELPKDIQNMFEDK